MPPSTALTALVLDVPVTPGAGQARDWARAELARREYAEARPGWFERLRDLVLNWFGSLSADGRGVSTLVLVLVLAAVAAAVVVALAWAGRPRPGRRGAAPAVFDGARPLSAADYRGLAERAADSEDWAEAVRHRFRALVAALGERGVPVGGPGATAQEAAAAAALALSGHGDELRAAATRFDETSYGGEPGSAEAYGRVAALDALLGAGPRVPR